MITRNKLLSDLTISSAQAFLNQLSGIIVFFIISRFLDKASLGHINWALAVLMVLYSIIGFGLEHITVKKAATGADLGLLLQTYLIHILVTSVGSFLLVWIFASKITYLGADRDIFLLLAISQCISFLASPFRQIVNGLEEFKSLFIMSSCANIIKAVLLLVLAFIHQVSLTLIVEVYILASVVELLVCVIVYKMHLRLPFTFGFDWKRYSSLVKEALPQLGVTIFNTAIQRMDWILLGILSTAVFVAEYSFTNKIFELATLPLLIIAPIIFPKIAKMYGENTKVDQSDKIAFLKMVVRIEIIVAVFVALAVNICWKNIIDPLTDNKYGTSTINTIFIMSFAMPLLYINNIFWSILFAQGKLRTLFFIFLSTFLVNIVADSILIPFYMSNGAAAGFVFALAVQTVLYFRKIESDEIRNTVIHIFPVIFSAIIAGGIAVYLFSFFLWQLFTATCIYFSLLSLFKQTGVNDWVMIKGLIKPIYSKNNRDAVV